MEDVEDTLSGNGQNDQPQTPLTENESSPTERRHSRRIIRYSLFPETQNFEEHFNQSHKIYEVILITDRFKYAIKENAQSLRIVRCMNAIMARKVTNSTCLENTCHRVYTAALTVCSILGLEVLRGDYSPPKIMRILPDKRDYY